MVEDSRYRLHTGLVDVKDSKFADAAVVVHDDNNYMAHRTICVPCCTTASLCKYWW